MNNQKSFLKILVCDDDPADRKLVRAYIHKIKNREIVLIEAGDKKEIEQALEKGRIDLVQRRIARIRGLHRPHRQPRAALRLFGLRGHPRL